MYIKDSKSNFVSVSSATFQGKQSGNLVYNEYIYDISISKSFDCII